MRRALGTSLVRRWVLTSLVLVWLLYVLGLIFEARVQAFENVVYYGLLLAAPLICGLRALLVRSERLAWSLLTFGMLASGCGDLYYGTLDSDALPSLADLGWLAFYPASFAALALLTRARVARADRGLWLDGLLGACAVTSLVAALAFQPIVDAGSGSPVVVATNLAYPVGDMLLLGLVIAAVGLTGWRPDRTWMLLGAALVVSAVADGWYLYLVAAGGYEDGMLLEALWPAAMLLVAASAWEPERARVPTPRIEGWRVMALPALFMLTALGLLVADHFHRLADLAVLLAAVAMALGTARMGMIFRTHLRMLAGSRIEATTDSLTGLRNRRALLADLADQLALATPAEPRLLVLFDLDGFKDYNDSYGHMIGDELLMRLGRRLGDAVAPRGYAYRLGGDEFSVLLRPGPAGVEPLIAAARAALREEGDGFVVQSSYGAVLLPVEADAVSAALQLADQRMYAHKHGGRGTAGRQSRDVLLSTLREREPDLHDHLEGVTELAAAVAEALGMSPEDQSDVARAAELHDVGKIAIPDAILRKPGPLDDAEWEFMRRHTIIGERILMSAPALKAVATLVRASHERWDGQGYPDGLAGERIPLGARIVSVCDAYDAMVSDRPYRAGMPPGDALEELRRCSGSQFDPDVVDAFGRVIAREAELRPA
jgi:two-component system, cell cycle response regulator